MYKKFNPNPRGNDFAGDCVIRAIVKATGQTWESVFVGLSLMGYFSGDWGNSNGVWDAYLRKNGFKRYILPNTCPYCYTIADFARDHPNGGVSKSLEITDFDTGTPFSKKINGKPVSDVVALFDEVMEALQAINPPLYASIMRKI